MIIHFLEEHQGEDVTIEFEVHPYELVTSVALRYAKKKGLPHPPPRRIATLCNPIRTVFYDPKTTIGGVVKSGGLLFTLGSLKGAQE